MKLPQKTTTLISLLFLVGLIVLFPFLFKASQTVQQLLSRATGKKASIVVNAKHTLEPITPFWQSFAQGGEESTNMIAPVVSEMTQLDPKFIRIDHIYDHHPTVTRSETGTLVFNFSSLDGVIKSIRATGATPFISLSYMPQALASGDITSTPKNWNEWALVVQKTIEHISGKNNLNIENVYYEVWNEPDLFGNWKYSGEKNYLTLYRYAALGASNAQNTNNYKLGGPATTQLYKNWIVALAEFTKENNIRIDFISWHRYTTDPTQYTKDLSEVTSWLFRYPSLVNLPRIISEWGFDSDINPRYDGNFAAAHTAATIRQAINGYSQLFTFEIVDGKDPAGNKYWGRWGLLTHPSLGKTKKPRFEVFKLLNQIEGQRLLVTGEGTWVSALASTTNQVIKILLINYDQAGTNTETVPLSITSLENGTYQLKTTRLGSAPLTTTHEITTSEFTTEVLMPVSSVVLLEVQPKDQLLGN